MVAGAAIHAARAHHHKEQQLQVHHHGGRKTRGSEGQPELSAQLDGRGAIQKENSNRSKISTSSRSGSKGSSKIRKASTQAMLRHFEEKDWNEQLEEMRFPWFWKYQPQMAYFYTDFHVQICVAGLIAGNFIVNMAEKQIDPRAEKYTSTFNVFEAFFNIAFTIELGINMYAFWFKRFWASGWNVFDVVVVAVGILTTTGVPLPGPFAYLRIMRAFRVFRLFKRVESLRRILESLAKAMPGVVNAFIILCLVMSIYAMLAVDFFSEFGNSGDLTMESGVQSDPTTPRGQGFGFEYYGNFLKAWYTLFQVLMGDSWSEACVRRMLHHKESWTMQVGVGFFYTSFVIVNGIVLVNVVVAVLLEKIMGGKSDGMDPGMDGFADDMETDDAHVDKWRDDVAELKEKLDSILSVVKGMPKPLKLAPPGIDEDRLQIKVIGQQEEGEGETEGTSRGLPGQAFDRIDCVDIDAADVPAHLSPSTALQSECSRPSEQPMECDDSTAPSVR